MAESTDDKPPEAPAIPGDAEPAAAAAPVEEAAAAAAAEAAPPAADRILELEAEVAVLKDKMLRALAEAENVRRRAERDVRETAKYAIANFAREMLLVADSLRRALESLPAEARQNSLAVENLVVGIEITEKAMLGAFERVGIRPIAALDQRFDHNLHEAMFEIEDSSQPPGTVVRVLETGYLLGDRLLRPAKVGIAKGGAEAAAKAEAGAAETPPPAETGAKGQAEAYEKQADAAKPSAPAGSKLDEKH